MMLALKTPCAAALACMIGAILALHPSTAAALYFPYITYGAPQAVGPGTTCCTATSSAPNPVWQIRIVEADLTNRNISLAPLIRTGTALQRTSVLAANAGAIAAINAGYFDGSTGAAYGYFIADGVKLSNNAVSQPPRAVFGVSGNHSAQLAQARIDGSGNTVPANADWPLVMDAIGAGPTLVTDGALNVGDVAENFGAASGIDPSGRQPRTVVGFNAATRRAWLVTVDGRQTGWSVGMTLTETAKLLLDLGATDGINYDGGGSTTCWVGGQVRNRPSDGSERSVATAWAVVPAYVIDNTDDDCTRTAGWNPFNAGTGFNGGELFSPGGDGSRSVTWRPALEQSGRYRVSAWWSSTTANATAAPFAVHRVSGVSLVGADQRANGGRWITLGSFNFNAGTDGYVTVSDAVATGQYVHADAVKFLRTGPLDLSGVDNSLAY